MSETAYVQGYFQGVIIVEYDDGRMYPLVDEEAPKCLLPVANRKLLAYQLDMVAKSGIAEVYIVAPSDYQVSLSQFLSEYVIRESMTIERIFVEKDNFNSCDALRAVSDRIRGDFICIHSDVFSRFSLGEMATFHRTRSSDLTMLLVPAPIDEPEKKGGKRKLRVEEEDQEYIGICEDGRVVMKLAVADAEEAVEVTKPLLHRCGTLSLRTDLLDMGIYILSRWLLEYVVENKHMESFKADVVPFFVDRQFQPIDYLVETFPSLQHRKRPIASLEPWLTSTTSYQTSADGLQFELIDSLGRDLLDAPRADTVNFAGILPPQPTSPRNTSLASLNSLTNFERTDSLVSSISMPDEQLDGGMGSPISGLVRLTGNAPSSFSRSGRGGRAGGNSNIPLPDLLRCYAFTIDSQGQSPAAGGPPPSAAGSSSGLTSSTDMSSPTNSEPLLLQRVTNIASYMTLNRDITGHTHTASTPWPRLHGYRKKEQSVVGDNTVIGASTTQQGDTATSAGSAAGPATEGGAKPIKGFEGEASVTLKSSIIGLAVSVGARSKINNSIIMDNVSIGEK